MLIQNKTLNSHKFLELKAIKFKQTYWNPKKVKSSSQRHFLKQLFCVILPECVDQGPAGEHDGKRALFSDEPRRQIGGVFRESDGDVFLRIEFQHCFFAFPWSGGSHFRYWSDEFGYCD